MHVCCRWMVVTGSAVGLVLGAVAPANADPSDDASASQYPEMDHITAYYTQLEPDGFTIPGYPGVWFLSPSGLNCGIWDWGSFGCTGDSPGSPPGDNHMAWSHGNRGVDPRAAAA